MTTKFTLFTWTGDLQCDSVIIRLYWSTLHQWGLRANAGRWNHPSRFRCRTRSKFCRNSRATVQLSTHYRRWHPVPVKPSQHRSPHSLVIHLQSTVTVTGSSHQPDITRLWTGSDNNRAKWITLFTRPARMSSLFSFLTISYLFTCWVVCWVNLDSWGETNNE